ncbi:zinc cluster transcription factor [Salix suchowensis]|nr:zinc cluster transcription factor [Salix suchowensis]
MARQSAWIGRRGKPRCDHCRLNNLKVRVRPIRYQRPLHCMSQCDRILPTCNHCSWASGRECRYTPLPTPAHRGIPRCDRCRRKNLKVWTTMPSSLKATEYASISVRPELASESSPTSESVHHDGLAESKRAHTFYGQNVATRNGESPQPPILGGVEGSPDLDKPIQSQTGRFTADYLQSKSQYAGPLPVIPPKPSSLGDSSLSFISHAFAPGQGIIINSTYVQPWSHPSFSPLPESILQRLGSVDSSGMPNRETFDDNIANFLGDLLPELRDTACLPPDIYLSMSRSLVANDLSKLPARLRDWISINHIRSGSSKGSLLLVPRDSIFQAADSEVTRLLKAYRDSVDGSNGSDDESSGDVDFSQAFERLLVRNQLYDVLAYAHRSHGPPPSMLFELRKAAIAYVTWPMIEIFIRLCPLCNNRAKRRASAGKLEAPVEAS